MKHDLSKRSNENKVKNMRLTNTEIRKLKALLHKATPHKKNNQEIINGISVDSSVAKTVLKANRDTAGEVHVNN